MIIKWVKMNRVEVDCSIFVKGTYTAYNISNSFEGKGVLGNEVRMRILSM